MVFLDSGPGQFWTEASGCKSQDNKACTVVSNDAEHMNLARAAKSDPQPAYNVKDENCGVLAADSDGALMIKSVLNKGQ